jgi:hypothetical protein
VLIVEDGKAAGLALGGTLYEVGDGGDLSLRALRDLRDLLCDPRVAPLLGCGV